jgi:cytochrome d ubiquinol oxidase subunit I
MVFNPSSVDRLVHVLLGSFILGAFFVMSITAYYLLRSRHVEFARRSFTIALGAGAIASLAMLVSGHSQARVVAAHQPAKLAAFEGHFVTGPAPLYLFGVPDAETQRVRGIAVPGLLSFLIHGRLDAPVPGLDSVPEGDRPPVQLPFQAYHLMVGLGGFFIAVTALALWLRWRGRLFETRWLLHVFVFAVAGAYAANQLGWVAAEVGRQPWIVYGLLRTSDALSKAVGTGAVATSIAMFSVIYLLLFAVWVYVLNDKIQHGPEEAFAHAGPGDGAGLLDIAAQRAGQAAHLTGKPSGGEA